jgi:DNA-binding CsgD family transcriptional regulator
VTPVARLGAPDVDGALALVGEATAADGAEPFELPVVERLRALLPADRAGYFELRGRRPNIFDVDTQGYPDDFDWYAEEHQEAINAWPLHDPLRGCPDQALKLSDFLTPRQVRCNPWYVQVMRPNAREHEMKLWLPAPVGTVRGFFFLREPGRRDFDERERALLTVLRPHLAAVRERWEQRHHPQGLTKRETELLTLVRQGLTNREIAEQLVITPGTVRAHLENIYEKLGVHTRTAAVARAFATSATDHAATTT